jgi:hypothetical protein
MKIERIDKNYKTELIHVSEKLSDLLFDPVRNVKLESGDKVQFTFYDPKKKHIGSAIVCPFHSFYIARHSRVMFRSYPHLCS